MPSTELWRDTQKLERQGESEQSGAPGCTIWIELDNSPHVPFFRPIIHVFFEQLGLPAPDGRADLPLGWEISAVWLCATTARFRSTVPSVFSHRLLHDRPTEGCATASRQKVTNYDSH